MKKILFYAFIFFIIGKHSSAQVTISGATGINGNYTSLSAINGAFMALETGPSQAGQDVVITISGDNAIEDGQFPLHHKNWNSLIIKPSGHRTIQGNTSYPMINLNSVTDVTIDGLNDAINSLTISNIFSDSDAGSSTVTISGDATSNTIQNCTILGSTNGFALSDTYYTCTLALAPGGTSTGCDNNEIRNNLIGSSGAGLHSVAIASWGTSETITNDGNTIIGNYICDFYNTTSGDPVGIMIGRFNSACSIIGNRIYQSAPRSGLYATRTLKAIWIDSPTAGGFVISGNVIGYSSYGGTGMFTCNGGRFAGIDINVASSPVSGIQGNVINGINWTCDDLINNPPSSSFTGILVRNGNVNIGTVTGNIVGAATGNGSITENIWFEAIHENDVCGIYAASTGTVQIVNNTVAAITMQTPTDSGCSFRGITIEGTGDFTVNSNHIGSTTANSVNLTIDGSSNAFLYYMGIMSSASGTVVIGEEGKGNIIMNITNNSVLNSSNYGIMSFGEVTGSLSISNNHLDYFNFPAAATEAMCYGIYGSADYGATSVNMNRNYFGPHFLNYAAGGTGMDVCMGFQGVLGSEIISWNIFDVQDVNSTGDLFLIRNACTSVPGSSRSISQNVAGGLNKTAGGTVHAYYEDYFSPGVTYDVAYNNFSNITVASPGGFDGIIVQGGMGSRNVNVISNTITNITCEGFYGISAGGFAGTEVSPNVVMGNIIASIYCTGGLEFTGINVNGANQYLHVYDNLIADINVSGPGSWVTGIYCGVQGHLFLYQNMVSAITNTSPSDVYGLRVNSAAAIVSVHNNYVNTISAVGSIYGILLRAASGNVYQHKLTAIDEFSIHGLTSSAGSVKGIFVFGGNPINIYENNFYDLSYTGTGSATGQVNGIYLFASAAASVFNNTIGKLTAPSSNSGGAINGICITSSASANYSVHNNTVLLDATSTGTTFGTSAIYHRASATASTSVLDMRNNLFINKSVAAGAGKTSAYCISTPELANFASTSNNNILYAGVPSASNVIFYDSTGYDMTIDEYKTRVAPRESLSETEDVLFTSTNPADAGFLHVNFLYPTLSESGGTSIPGISSDVDGDLRFGIPGYGGTGTAVDIGADEFEGAREYIWNGSVSDNWNFGLNWTPNSVPTPPYNVKIPGGTPNPCIVKNLNMGCKNMIIHCGSSDGMVTIEPGTSLHINGNLIKHGNSSLTNNGILEVAGNIIQN